MVLMMKRIASILVLFILIASTVGVVINKHYCGGNLASISLFSSSGPCGCGDKNMDEGCCQDKASIVQLDEDYNSSSFELNISSDYATMSLAQSVNSFILKINTANYQRYIPPLIERDIPLFVQSFLL